MPSGAGAGTGPQSRLAGTSEQRLSGGSGGSPAAGALQLRGNGDALRFRRLVRHALEADAVDARTSEACASAGRQYGWV